MFSDKNLVFYLWRKNYGGTPCSRLILPLFFLFPPWSGLEEIPFLGPAFLPS